MVRRKRVFDNFCEKRIFCEKRNFCEKSKFLTTIEICDKNRIFVWQKSKFTQGQRIVKKSPIKFRKKYYKTIALCNLHVIEKHML